MRLRVIALAVFLFQIALGDLCMMQMASAHDMDMDMPSMHGSHHCENCSPENEGASHEEPMNGMNCGDGHCLMHDKGDSGSAIQSTNPLSTASIPSSPNTILPTLLSQAGPVVSAPPPDIPFAGKGMVFRC